MITFTLALLLLIGGYFIYGKYVSNVFGPDDRETPAISMEDGVDYVVMPTWRIFLIQLLNIAGLGPIWGAVGGAMWGPSVFLWITFGTVFVGAVHDFASGFMSMRHEGKSVPELTGMYMGNTMKQVMRVFSTILLFMVGVVFAVGPAGLLTYLGGQAGAGGLLVNKTFWLVVIFVYFFIATFLSIDKIIGKLYPIFGACLIIMAIGVSGSMLFSGKFVMPELWENFGNQHPQGTPIWSFMFIAIACGAISGFHATQSPLMARCMKSERQGRFVFYGAMVCEGVIALIWAAAACAMYQVVDGQNVGLAAALKQIQPAGVVYEVCTSTMGGIGVTLAMLGVVACPITSGDTAFRSARLVIADWFGLPQAKWQNRLLLCIPLLGTGALLSQIDYSIVWRYFSWTNQTLAMIVLWAAAMYLFKNKKNYWICAVPATFMSAVSITYFCMAKECLGLVLALPTVVSYGIGIAAAVLFLTLFLRATKKAVNDGLQVDMDQAIVVEEKLFGSCFETEDQKNAMGAFLEKRKPDPFVNR